MQTNYPYLKTSFVHYIKPETRKPNISLKIEKETIGAAGSYLYHVLVQKLKGNSAVHNQSSIRLAGAWVRDLITKLRRWFMKLAFQTF